MHLPDRIHAILQAFHPLHFVASMGIGMCSGIMYNFPIQSARRGFKYVGLIYFFTNLVVLTINHILFILKYMILPYTSCNNNKRYEYNTTFMNLMERPEMAVFMGASSMSFTSMINALKYIKPNWNVALQVLWWINFFQALSCILIVQFFLMAYPTHRLHRLKNNDHGNGNGINDDKHNVNDEAMHLLKKVMPAHVLPLVTCTVTAASGGLVMQGVSTNGGYLLALVIINFMMLSAALGTTLLTIPVIFVRYYVWGIPPRGGSFTTFVPIGLMGQGGLGTVLIARGFLRMLDGGNGFSKVGLPVIRGEMFIVFENAILVMAVAVSMFLASLGVVLTVWGVLSVCYNYIGWPHQEKRLHSRSDGDITVKGGRVVVWTPTMWAATFPLGTICLSTHEIYDVTGIVGFKILSSIYAFAVIIITTWCMVGTALYVVPWSELLHKKGKV